MKAWQGCLLAVGAVILVAVMMGGCLVGSYNGMVNEKVACEAGWAQVENVYQRRADLIPNIVAAVKGEKNFEQETLIAVTQARASVGQLKIDPKNITPEMMAQFQKAQEGLAGALQRLLVVTENYPTLKSNAGFQDLRASLEGSENRIAVERREYNKKVEEYNSHIQRFPSNMVAGFGNFKPMPLFKAEEGAQKAPKVDFDKK